MDPEYVISESRKHGFTGASLIKAEKLVFDPAFRRFCEENRCGHYNANYSCPPYCGTAEEMIGRARRYENALVLATNTAGVSALVPAVTRPLKISHIRRTRELVNALTDSGELPAGGLFMMASFCCLCDSCGMTEGRPCEHPELRTSCVSAYCVDSAALAESAGIPISWSLDQITYFSVYLF